ncbi:hypothetical protein HGL76_001335 [Campylobacter coli]|nr:hypothetical protein [Campylobacter coli]EEO8699840.1 hypothetical protein [Campylobacter coli]EFB6939347.1 hypothetical protein [Campylobacter coli]EHG8705497.1 hypothetical protein [Campylobacter coli]EHZ1716422.1 hypothetical protein [Campylobacter coli]
MNIKKTITSLSIVCSMALMPIKALSSQYVSFNNNVKTIQKTIINHIDFYKQICDSLYSDMKFNFNSFMCCQHGIIELDEIKKFKKEIKILNKIISVSKERMEKKGSELKDFDAKVYYASVALKSAIEQKLNPDFVKIFGAYKGEEIDIIEYAKGVLKAEEEIKNAVY